jgi:hypothetical protein
VDRAGSLVGEGRLLSVSDGIRALIPPQFINHLRTARNSIIEMDIVDTFHAIKQH